VCFVALAVYEVFERMAYYGISSNLVLYLTKQLHQGTVLSANNVTNWVGTIWMTPIIGAYIADAHLGRYRTFMVASVIYLLVSFISGSISSGCRFVMYSRLCHSSMTVCVMLAVAYPAVLRWQLEARLVAFF
jgi:dipeptide/tripeptide permease